MRTQIPIPSPRFRPKSQSIPPPSRTVPVICWPMPLVEHRLPGDETEAQAAIAAEALDHGETPAGELGRADELAADIFAGPGLLKGEAAFGGHRPADSGGFGALQP